MSGPLRSGNSQLTVYVSAEERERERERELVSDVFNDWRKAREQYNTYH